MKSWACARRAAASISSRARVRRGRRRCSRDGGGEQERVVVDDRDLRAQRRQVDVAHVGAVDQHAPAVVSYRRGISVDQRRLARAGGADERHGRPGGHVERDVVQRRARRGARRSCSDTPRSSTRPLPGGSARAPGVATIRGSRSRIWKTRAPGGGRALGEAERDAQRAHRRDQHQQVDVEGAELADRQRAVDHLAPADQQHRGEAELRQEADQRVVDGLQARGDHRLVEHAPDLRGGSARAGAPRARTP